MIASLATILKPIAERNHFIQEVSDIFYFIALFRNVVSVRYKFFEVKTGTLNKVLLILQIPVLFSSDKTFLYFLFLNN